MFSITEIFIISENTLRLHPNKIEWISHPGLVF